MIPTEPNLDTAPPPDGFVAPTILKPVVSTTRITQWTGTYVMMKATRNKMVFNAELPSGVPLRVGDLGYIYISKSLHTRLGKPVRIILTVTLPEVK